MPNPDSAMVSDEELLAFLMGEGPMEGVWFGQKHPTKKGIFWWRRGLRAAWHRRSAAPPSEEVVEAVASLLELCEHANAGAFQNGVTDQTGSIDEGEVRASEIMGRAREAYQKATEPRAEKDQT